MAPPSCAGHEQGGKKGPRGIARGAHSADRAPGACGRRRCRCRGRCGGWSRRRLFGWHRDSRRRAPFRLEPIKDRAGSACIEGSPLAFVVRAPKEVPDHVVAARVVVTPQADGEIVQRVLFADEEIDARRRRRTAFVGGGRAAAVDHDRGKCLLKGLGLPAHVRCPSRPAHHPQSVSIERMRLSKAIDRAAEPRRVSIPTPPAPLASFVRRTGGREDRHMPRLGPGPPSRIDHSSRLTVAVQDDEQRRGLWARGPRRQTSAARRIDRARARRQFLRPRGERDYGDYPCDRRTPSHGSLRSADKGKSLQKGVSTPAAPDVTTNQAPSAPASTWKLWAGM